MVRLSRATGVLFDPPYSARLVALADRVLVDGDVGDRLMIIHIGGLGLLALLSMAHLDAHGGRLDVSDSAKAAYVRTTVSGTGTDWHQRIGSLVRDVRAVVRTGVTRAW